MKDILKNLALILLNEHCKNNGKDISGTYIKKRDKKWIYSLVRQDKGNTICTVQFYKSQIPVFNLYAN